MTDLFTWGETAAPAPVWQGPPRPDEIVLDSAWGLDLIDRKNDSGWTARFLVRDTDSGLTVPLAHLATWGDFRSDDVDVGVPQFEQAQTWWHEVAKPHCTCCAYQLEQVGCNCGARR